MSINLGRVVLGGLAAGVVMNFVDFLGNGLWLGASWEAEALAINPDAASLVTQSMVGWIVTDLLFGLSIVWIYAAIRPRFGPGAGTALMAAFEVWAISHIAYASLVFLGFHSLNLFIMSSIVGLVAACAGGLVGGYLYKEDAPARPATV